MKKTLCIFLIMSGLASQASVVKVDDQTFRGQIARAQNTSLTMGQRWDALLKATDLASGEEINQVLEFAKNKDWYMRNAVLVALDKNGNDMVYEKAKLLLTDKALVVRSAAVDIIGRLDNIESRKMLTAELNKKYNYIGKKSLWIRAQIMKTLAQNPQENEKEIFARSLFDDDKEVAQLSAHALEKLTPVRFEGEQKIESWKKYAKDHRWF